MFPLDAFGIQITDYLELLIAYTCWDRVNTGVSNVNIVIHRVQNVILHRSDISCPSYMFSKSRSNVHIIIYRLQDVFQQLSNGVFAS